MAGWQSTSPIERETAGPLGPARVVDEAADGAEPCVLVVLRRLVVKGELLEGVRPDEQRPRVAAVRRDVLERRDEDDVGDGPVRQPRAGDVPRVSRGVQTSLSSTNVYSTSARCASHWASRAWRTVRSQ